MSKMSPWSHLVNTRWCMAEDALAELLACSLFIYTAGCGNKSTSRPAQFMHRSHGATFQTPVSILKSGTWSHSLAPFNKRLVFQLS